MPSRRAEIRMTEGEVADFLAAHKTGVLGTVGPDGLPHMVNMGYLVEGPGGSPEGLAITSFRAAQKVKNIKRTGGATFLVEHAWPYSDVRGVMISGRTTIVDDASLVLDLTTRMQAKHAEMSGTTEGTPAIDLQRMAAKRVAVYLAFDRVRSWDHTKLGGTY